MLFWIFTIILTTSIVCIVMTNRWDRWDGLHTASCIVTALSGAIFVFMTIILIVQFATVGGEVKSSEIRYYSLVYQYENDFYNNDNDIGKKELMNQIQDWNEDLAFGKEMQRDFWIGIFIPNVYNQFEFIKLDALKE